MKIFNYKTRLFVSLFLVLTISPAFGQVTFNPLQIKISTLFEDLQKVKFENPRITADELAEQANTLLRKKGMNFVFAFDRNVCQEILDVQQKQKDKSQPVKLSATLRSVDGEGTKVVLPDISFEKNECGRCFIQMPLFEFSGKDFVTSIQSSNIKFYTPSNYIYNEVISVDTQNFSSEIRKWQVPFRSSPIGISDDGKLLYLELPEKGLSELTLIIYDEGGFQFYAKKELDLSAKPSILSEIPKDIVLPNTSFVKFTKDKKSQVLKYNTSCQ